ncbi:MBL fold metallo-hydrolase [Candidatus Hodarchaeum mangrovi]
MIKNFTLIKLGGSLITYKKDEQLIKSYLDEINRFLHKSSSLTALTKSISDLTNFLTLEKIFKSLKNFIDRYPNEKLILIHGAGSIGHSLVLFLQNYSKSFKDTYPIVKLAVGIQNQLIIGKAIQYGINAISAPSHLIIQGESTQGISTKYGDSPDLSLLEEILNSEISPIPFFYGDIGYTTNGWKVFSGDIIPGALARKFAKSRISRAIFLTNVEGKKTGIYSKDPIDPSAEFVTTILVSENNIEYLNSNNKKLFFHAHESLSNYDVTDAMTGKLRNLVELARTNTVSWVIGLEEFNQALNGEVCGTIIRSKRVYSNYLTFYGIGDAFSSGGKNSSAIYSWIDNKGILLDCGPQTLSTLKRHKKGTGDIDLILISHFHGDHFAGLPFILLEAMLLQRRKKKLTIIGPEGTKEQVENLFNLLYPSIASLEKGFPCEYVIINEDFPVEYEGIKISAFKMNHTPEALGYRIEVKNSSVAYSGDTGWTNNLKSLVQGTQFAIVECSFLEIELESHLNLQEALILAPLTKRLVLTHLGQDVLDQTSKIKREKIIIPVEGQTLWF